MQNCPTLHLQGPYHRGTHLEDIGCQIKRVPHMEPFLPIVDNAIELDQQKRKHEQNRQHVKEVSDDFGGAHPTLVLVATNISFIDVVFLNSIPHVSLSEGGESVRCR